MSGRLSITQFPQAPSVQYRIHGRGSTRFPCLELFNNRDAAHGTADELAENDYNLETGAVFQQEGL